jgi:hypothetical protein
MARRVLLAWEMGAGLGHSTRLIILAKALRDRGFEPVLAQRDVRTFSGTLSSLNIPTIPTPQIPPLTPRGEPFRAYSFADIMAIAGYADTSALQGLLQMWEGLLRYLRPDMVIGDYCPILPMAVRGRVPFLAFGDGFVVPPHEPPTFPALRKQGQPIQAIRSMTLNINRMLRTRGQREINHLGQLVAGDAQIICTVPELDIYQDHRSQPAAGPINEPPNVRPPPKNRRLFVYLAADYRKTRAALKAVLDSKVKAEGFIRDAPQSLRTALRNGGMLIHDNPPNLSDRLKEASVILHHGGIGTLETALEMGCPQLLVTRHLEQVLNARQLSRYKASRILDLSNGTKTQTQIQSALVDDDWQIHCQEFAASLKVRRPLTCLEQFNATIDMLIR